MRTKLFSTVAIIMALFATSVLSSCSKEKPATPLVKQLQQKAVYKITATMTVNGTDFDITNYLNGQTQASAIILPEQMELHVNTASATADEQSTSRLFTDMSVAFNQKEFTATETNDGSYITLTFNDKNPLNIGSNGMGGGQILPQALMQANVFGYNSNGNDGWYSFSANNLSGTYKIEQALDGGFRLTFTDTNKKITMNLSAI